VEFLALGGFKPHLPHRENVPDYASEYAYVCIFKKENALYFISVCSHIFICMCLNLGQHFCWIFNKFALIKIWVSDWFKTAEFCWKLFKMLYSIKYVLSCSNMKAGIYKL
jgi:hypothetical protein